MLLQTLLFIISIPLAVKLRDNFSGKPVNTQNQLYSKEKGEVMDKYEGFKSQIPEDVMRNVEALISKNVALFKPDRFIPDRLMYSVDFHIIIPSSPPPDSYINGKLQTFDSKKIITFNPGDSILCTGEGKRKQYLSLLIKPELMNRIVEEMGLSGTFRFLNTSNPFSRELVQAIHSFEKESARPDSFQLMLDCLSVQIVTLLVREFKSNLKEFPEQSPDMDVRLAVALEYIHAYYNTNITIEDICNEVHVSPFYFIRTFKKKMGVTPYQYLLKLRIQKAKELLKLGQYSVSETAALCGFVNLSHFSSFFKEMTGCSPLEYRKHYLH